MLKKIISIIIPTYNEEKNINLIHNQLINLLKQISEKYDYEIIFVNDGSKDKSWKEISHISENDKKTKGINFSRNFGHQIALTAGYNFATGDAVITMDADMQDTPKLILKMINEWEKGFHIVYARRTNRNDGFFKKLTASYFYKILSIVSDTKIPQNVSDFRLINKKVNNILKSLKEHDRYLRGLVSWTGFSHTFVNFERPNRIHGETSYSWKKMFKLALDGIISFTTLPSKIIFLIALFFLIAGAVSIFLPANKYNLILILFGVQLTCLWVIAEYAQRIYFQQKQRPLYIIQETINLEN